MNTSVLYYCAFGIVVISTAMFGLDWQPAALSPMAPIKVVAFAPPPPLAPVKAAAPSRVTRCRRGPNPSRRAAPAPPTRRTGHRSAGRANAAETFVRHRRLRRRLSFVPGIGLHL